MAGRAVPVRVAAVNDYEIVVDGLAKMLSAFPDRIVVCDRIVIGEPVPDPVDVALYDTYGRVGIAGAALRELAAMPNVGRVAIFSLDLHPDLVAEARRAGAAGFISKSLSAEQVASALVRIARGDGVLAATASPQPASAVLDWPGKADGLTERESQVLVLAAEGLSNREIAAALYLSSETVKSYLRQAFAKLQVRNRVEATNYVRLSGAFTRYQPAPKPTPE